MRLDDVSPATGPQLLHDGPPCWFVVVRCTRQEAEERFTSVPCDEADSGHSRCEDQATVIEARQLRVTQSSTQQARDAIEYQVELHWP